MSSATDRIERTIVLRAPRSRVWRALTEAREFGTWFGVKVEGTFPHARGHHRMNSEGWAWQLQSIESYVATGAGNARSTS